jgi:hypothetical protein
MEHHNQDSVNLDALRTQAAKSVIERDGMFTIQFEKPVQGIDSTKTYSTKELAIEAAYNALRNHAKSKAA